MLYATVRQRKIHVKNPTTVIQNGVGVDQIVLDMDDEWKDMTSIVCVFQNGETKKEKLHIFGQLLEVPWECLAETGRLTLSCTGYVGSEKVMTTMLPDSFWNVVQNGPVTGDVALEPTPTLYEQVLGAAVAANAAAQQLLQDKENGMFDGRDGITPHIGSNGNWYLGETDTGVKARGEDDDDYVLTDADKNKIAELAAELVVDDMVKTVNGIAPDENGNVKIEISGSVEDGYVEKEYTAEFSNTGFIRLNGTISTSSNGRHTDRISTKGMTKIRGIAGFYTQCTIVAFYAADGTALTNLNILGTEFISSGASYSDGTFELSITDEKYADAAYFVVSSYRYPEEGVDYTYARDFSDDYCKYTNLVQAEETQKPAYRIGKNTIVFFGDSICSGAGTTGGYAKQIQEITGCIANNQGKSGATIANAGNSTYKIVNMVKEFTGNADMIVIEGGTNDYNQGVALGEITATYVDALDETTFCGALESIIQTLITNYPIAQLFGVFTHRDVSDTATNANGVTKKEFHDKAVAIYEKYAIPYYDAYKDSGLITAYSSSTLLPAFFKMLADAYTYNGDKVHPNADGYAKYYVPQIIDMLERHAIIDASEIENGNTGVGGTPDSGDTEKEYTAEFSNTGFIRLNGTTSTSANGRYTDRISTEDVTKIRGIAGFYTQCAVVAFYAADGTALESLYLLGTEFIPSVAGYNDGTFELDITDEKYADAAYFVVSSYRYPENVDYTYAVDFSDDYCQYTKV